MKLIKPKEISARILTMLDESEERVIIVSPYMKVSKWYKMRKGLMDLKSRRILPEIYVRDDSANTATYDDLDELGLPYHKIPYLHCKLYMNERYGIQTSMNLLLSSEINALEIASVTDSQEEYHELMKFYCRYIYSEKVPRFKYDDIDINIQGQRFIYFLKEEIKQVEMNAWPWQKGDILYIATSRNLYSISTLDGLLRINAQLKLGREAYGTTQSKITLLVERLEDLAWMNVRVSPGRRAGTLSITGHIQLPLKTPIVGMEEAESDTLKNSVIRFMQIANSFIIGNEHC